MSSENNNAGIANIKPTFKDAENVSDIDYELLPMYEKILNDRLIRKNNSLKTNELYKCRWQSYKDTFSDRVFKPFEFPDVRDYCFYKYHTRLLPEQSLRYRTDFRKKLSPGPGVDSVGQRPIPCDLHMKRGSAKVENKQGTQVPANQSKMAAKRN